MTKILIFGLPRTATTALQLELVPQFRVKSLKEPFCGDSIADDVYTWVKEQQDCVMKLLTTNLLEQQGQIDIIKLIDSGITHVAVTQRKNFVDCCVSLYYAERIANQYHYSSKDQIKFIKFEVDEHFLTNWLTEVDMYYRVLDRLAHHQVKYDVFDYDMYVERQPQTIFERMIGATQNHNYIHTNISYAELCLNYQEVKTKIEDHVKRLQR